MKIPDREDPVFGPPLIGLGHQARASGKRAMREHNTVWLARGAGGEKDYRVVRWRDGLRTVIRATLIKELVKPGSMRHAALRGIRDDLDTRKRACPSMACEDYFWGCAFEDLGELIGLYAAVHRDEDRANKHTCPEYERRFSRCGGNREYPVALANANALQSPRDICRKSTGIRVAQRAAVVEDYERICPMVTNGLLKDLANGLPDRRFRGDSPL